MAKPTLHLGLSGLFEATKKSTLDVSIRYLNIEDGTLILKVSDGTPIDFRSLAMNAQNLNVGGATGLNLRTDVPSLEGVAEIMVIGDEKEKKPTIRVEQNRPRGFTNLIKGKN